MYAVIKTGGKQYKVTQGDVLQVEKLAAAEGDTISFDQVLMVADGGDVQVGTPTVAGTSVSATVKKHGRGRKIEVIKFRRRKHHRKQMGHRQDYTEVEITAIGGKGDAARPASRAKTAAPKKQAATAPEPTAKIGDKPETGKSEAAASSKSQSVLLKAPKGEPDDLKQLSGLGPKIAEKLNEAGIFHFWQIAEISAGEIARLEEELKLAGRFERDDWVKQAKELAKGG